MHAKNLSALDLNLLVALDALLRERHVGRAAARIHRSQPAVSHALSRLRMHFDDALLVQSGRSMVLTPRAESMREPLGQVMRSIGGLFSPQPFNPRTSDRQFRVMMPDFIAESLMPALMKQLSAQAPGIRVQLAEWRGEQTLTRDYLDSIDLILSGWMGRFHRFEREPLFEDSDVIASRLRGRSKSGRYTLRRLLSVPHVAVIGPGEREDPVDTWLAALGHVRPIMLSVPTYLLALRIVANTDMLAIVPGRMLARLGSSFGVAPSRLPIDPGVDPMYMHFSGHTRADSASTWFRDVLRSCV